VLAHFGYTIFSQNSAFTTPVFKLFVKTGAKTHRSRLFSPNNRPVFGYPA